VLHRQKTRPGSSLGLATFTLKGAKRLRR
jgi:hypothetical protein